MMSLLKLLVMLTVMSVETNVLLVILMTTVQNVTTDISYMKTCVIPLVQMVSGVILLTENVNHVTPLVVLVLPEILTDVLLVQLEDGITKEDVLKNVHNTISPKNTQESVLLVLLQLLNVLILVPLDV
jgi:hypothetical protein